jgi:acetyl-CoA hydrolase
MSIEVDLAALDFSTIVRPGDTVAWGQASAEPVPLTRTLLDQRQAIGPFTVFVGASYSDTLDATFTDCVKFVSYCGAGNNRALADAGKLDILPCHYSQLPRLINGSLRIDVVLVQVAPADASGRFSLSLAHDYLVPMLDSARVIVAEVNDQAPWTHGSRTLRHAELHYIVPTSRPPQAVPRAEPGPTELAIGRHVASLVGDGDTLQLGLGALPEAVLSQLGDRRDLGIHSGSIGDRVADMMESGVITNARKSIDRHATIAGVMFGTQRLFAFAHRNPRLQFRSVEYTHAPETLARIDRFIAINSAVEVDMTGQINAEFARGTYVGAVGGAGDFLRGAHRSKGGLPIIALPSTSGQTSRIVTTLHGPVSTPRSDAGIIVTEYGVADLRGQTISTRIRRMLDVAHPDHREALSRAGRD